MKLEILQQIF